jgi:hypothetical protein
MQPDPLGHCTALSLRRNVTCSLLLHLHTAAPGLAPSLVTLGVPQLLEQDQGPITHLRGQCSESRAPRKLRVPARIFRLHPIAAVLGRHRDAPRSERPPQDRPTVLYMTTICMESSTGQQLDAVSAQKSAGSRGAGAR